MRGTGVLLIYQLMFGRGSDPNEEQLRYNCSPAETRTGGDGVMNGPEGIAEMKKATFTFPLYIILYSIFLLCGD